MNCRISVVLIFGCLFPRQSPSVKLQFNWKDLKQGGHLLTCGKGIHRESCLQNNFETISFQESLSSSVIGVWFVLSPILLAFPSWTQNGFYFPKH